MKKLFISQPMRDKTDEEILKEREEIIKRVKEETGDEIEVIDSFFKAFTLEYDPLGNISTIDVPSYNRITETDSIGIRVNKQKMQMEQYNQWNNALENAKPLWFLAKSLELMAKADIVVFAKDWNKYRGCRIEHQCAESYEIPIIYS